MIRFDCGECGKRLKAPESAVGKVAKCPHCGHGVPIVGPGSTSSGSYSGPAGPPQDAEEVEYDTERLDESDSSDPRLIRRRQLQARGRRRLAIVFFSFAILVVASGGLVALAFKRANAARSIDSGGEIRGLKSDEPRNSPFGSAGKDDVEGVVDAITMDMADFLNAGLNQPNENKLVIVLKRKGQGDAVCYFPPNSISERWPPTVDRGDRMIISGKMQSNSANLTTLTNCKVVAHLKR